MDQNAKQTSSVWGLPGIAHKEGPPEVGAVKLVGGFLPIRLIAHSSQEPAFLLLRCASTWGHSSNSAAAACAVVKPLCCQVVVLLPLKAGEGQQEHNNLGVSAFVNPF